MLNYHHIIIPQAYHHIPMLYETKTQNAGEFSSFVSHRHSILK